MAGSESRIEIVNSRTVYSGSVSLEGDLRQVGDATINPSAIFAGPGTLVIDSTGQLNNAPQATIGTDLLNEGVVAPGGTLPQFAAGQLNLALDYTQTTTATLEIELGGVARAPDTTCSPSVASPTWPARSTSP